MMKLDHLILAVALLIAPLSLSALADAKAPVVGKTTMSPGKNIVQNAGASKEHATFAKAIKAAGLSDTLEGPGPFTVFAPTNEAFKKLPPGTVENLLAPENKTQLEAVLTYNIVPGTLTTKDMLEKIKAGAGKATLKTIQGEDLTIESKGRSIQVRDGKGDVAIITAPNVAQSNGIMQVTNTLLLP